MEYNGWKNYETWAVNMWLTNDPSTDGYWRDAAQTAYDEATPTDLFTQCQQAKLDFADELKSHHEEYQPQTGGVYDDLLSAAMGEVDWYEIAEHFINELDDCEQAS